MKGKKRTRERLVSHDPLVAAVHQMPSGGGEGFAGDAVGRGRERTFDLR